MEALESSGSYSQKEIQDRTAKFRKKLLQVIQKTVITSCSCTLCITCNSLARARRWRVIVVSLLCVCVCVCVCVC